MALLVTTVLSAQTPGGTSTTSCTALSLTPGIGGAIELSNAGAGTEAGEPAPLPGHCEAQGYWCGGAPQNTVWARFVVPDEGAYEVSTCNFGTSFDTRIAVYTPQGCFYTLVGYDSFGDGWNDGFVTFVINGQPTNITMNDGSFQTWSIEVQNNQSLEVFWTPGGWPEEVSFQLLDPEGNEVLNAQPIIPQGQVYSGTANCSGNLCSLANFELLTASDDTFGGCSPAPCGASLPACVVRGSSAFSNVIFAQPECCTTAWEPSCQQLYDTFNDSCTGGGAGACVLSLNGWDSFGDGWNDGFVTVTVNGTPTNYTIENGSIGSWNIAVDDGANITVSWTPGGWPEEVSFTLTDVTGNVLVSINPAPPIFTNLYSGVVSCTAPESAHLGASRCFVSCLTPGTVCYVQIDGHNGATGNAVLSVRPYEAALTVDAQLTHVVCPPGIGLPAEGSIIPFIDGWGTSHTPVWTAPDGTLFEDTYVAHAVPGTYYLNAEDLCGNVVTASFEVEGPGAFLFENSITPACGDSPDGHISVAISGGTPPYSSVWWGPDAFSDDGESIADLTPGSYFMWLTDDAGCSIIQTVEVTALELPIFSFPDPMVICEDVSFLLEGPIADTYTWSTGTQSQNLIVSGSGLGEGHHEITLTATNEPGCSYSETFEVTVEICTGIAGQPATAFALYPNPTNGRVWLTGLPQGATGIHLYTADGRTVRTWPTGGAADVVIDVFGLPPGWYLVEVRTPTAHVRQKLIVNH